MMSQQRPPADRLNELFRRLADLSLAGGGYPYYRGSTFAVEPTVFAALALITHDDQRGVGGALADRVARLQNKDGSIGLGPSQPGQGLWVTAEAAILLHHAGKAGALSAALDFLMATRSTTASNDPRIKQNNTLRGWPWIPGTFGWVEPTAWSLIALTLSGHADHERAVEGRRLLLDRQIPSGGWNYGNPGLNDSELLPFWDTTGLALVALLGLVGPEEVERSLDLLETSQARIGSLCGLAWAVLGLKSYRRPVARLNARLLEALSGSGDDLNIAHFALGLIALSEKRIFAP